MNTPALPRSCWIVTEGLAGTENQCIAVAEALGLMPEIKRIGLRQPWKALSPWLGLERAGTFDPPLSGPPWPDILITSGRKAVAASRYIKRMSGGRTFTAHIQDPRVSPRHFDLLAVPQHDPVRGANVVVTLAAPTRITPAKLAVARHAFARFETLPGPRVAVLIGGNSRSHRLTPALSKALAAQLAPLEAGLMITASRRTGEENAQILREALAGDTRFFWDGTGENPYMGMLGWADFILVTSDSTSMISDAASTGKPVYVVKLEGGSRRLNAMIANLEKAGHIRPFSGALEAWSPPPLNDAAKIATEIRRLWR